MDTSSNPDPLRRILDERERELLAEQSLRRPAAVDWSGVERLTDSGLSDEALYAAMELFSEPQVLFRKSTDSLVNLGWFLILARFAQGITSADLAGRLGLTEAEVLRWEDARYKGVSVDDAQRVLDALGVRLEIAIQWSQG